MRSGTPAILVTRGVQRPVAQERGLPCVDKNRAFGDRSLIFPIFQQACDAAPKYAQNHPRWFSPRRWINRSPS